ncbi:MAG: GNAT family N-acetyltransferase [Hyphomonadaceae bacterium]
MNQTPTLAGADIVLRPLIIADAPSLFLALGDPQVQLYRRQPAHLNVDEARTYIADTLARSRCAWAITTDGGEALGRLALREPEPSIGEFGIVLRRAAQGRGLGSKAIALAEAHAFEDLGFTALRANIDAENAASLALFRRAGFSNETFEPATRATELGIRDSIILQKQRP